MRRVRVVSLAITLPTGLLGVLLFCHWPCYAQESAREITLAESLRLFAVNNLSLQGARSEAAAHAGLARQAAAFPNPVARFSHEPRYLEGMSDWESYATFDQRVEWPALRASRINAALRLQEAAQARVGADSLRLAFEVVRTYIEAAAADARYNVLHRVTDVIRAAEASWTHRHAEGAISGYDLRRMRIERSRYENDLALADLDRRSAQRHLALLVMPEGNVTALTPSDTLGRVPGELVLAELLGQARLGRPEVSAAHAQVEASAAALSYARLERRPEPMLTAGYKRQSDGFFGIFLAAGLNLPVYNRNAGQIMAESARLHAAETRWMLAIRQVEAEVRHAYATYASLQERFTLIQQGLLADTGDLLHIALTSYREGELELIELFDAARAYRDAQLTSLDLASAYWTSYFDALRAAGSPMPTSLD